jgi:hypothetical protein
MRVKMLLTLLPILLLVREAASISTQGPSSSLLPLHTGNVFLTALSPCLIRPCLVSACSPSREPDCQRIAPRGFDQFYLSTDLRFRYGANFSFVVASGLAGGGSISLVSCQGQNRYLTINAANNPTFAVLNSSSAVFAQQASFVLVADAWCDFRAHLAVACARASLSLLPR